jgi:hypothetical protein
VVCTKVRPDVLGAVGKRPRNQDREHSRRSALLKIACATIIGLIKKLATIPDILGGLLSITVFNASFRRWDIRQMQ